MSPRRPRGRPLRQGRRGRTRATRDGKGSGGVIEEHAGIGDAPGAAPGLRAKAEQLARELVALVATIAP